jgi:hypothetical protein
MNNTTKTILTNAAAAATSTSGVWDTGSFAPFAHALIQAGFLGVGRGPLKAPGLWVFITPKGRAAL